MTRCCVCKRKIRLNQSVISCKCDKILCNKHRFPDQHECTYNFKKENKKLLARTLVQVECEKVLKI